MADSNGVPINLRELRRQRDEQIVAAVLSGADCHDVAKSHGVSVSTVESVSAGKRHAHKQIVRKQCAEFLRGGGTIAQASERFGKTTAWATACAAEFGVKLKSQRRVTISVRQLQILAPLINTDDTYAEIGSQLGITKQRVEQVAALAVLCGIKLHESRM